MLNYVPKALTHFQHTPPRIPQHQPYPYVKSTYGAKAQYTEDVNTSLPLDKKGKKYIQEVIGTFLYYACCINSTMLLALGSLATQQANPMQNTKKLVHQFLNYATTHPDAIITYQASWSQQCLLPFLNQHMQQGRWTYLRSKGVLDIQHPAIIHGQ
jgi:hypothetical protein